MLSFLYTRSKLHGRFDHKKSVLIALIAIIFLAVPFVNGVLWILFEIFHFERDDRSVYFFIGPIATTVTVLAIIGPAVVLWNRLFEMLDEEANRAQIAQAEAERLLGQRTDFVAYISHEIRNPLNAIMGIADMMDKEKLETEDRKRVEIIQSSSSDLMFILNDILDISKLDEGELKLRPQPMSICDTVDQVMSFWKPRAEEAGLNLSLTLECAFKALVHMDEYRFRQVLNNLISNAIKYTERGSVLVSAERVGEGDMIQIVVADTGVGIPPDQVDLVFSAYQQVNEGDQGGRKHKVGTGLGLPIARRLARLMGGDVRLMDTGSSGSKFAFSFVAKKVELDEAQRWDDDAFSRAVKNCTALVVDDSMASSIVAREHLQKIGIRADILNSGHEAIERLKTQKYDLILLDDNLGEMRGIEIIKASQSAPSLGFVVYTGYVDETAREDFLAQGYQGFLGKPATRRDFKNEVQRLWHLQDQNQREDLI